MFLYYSRYLSQIFLNHTRVWTFQQKRSIHTKIQNSCYSVYISISTAGILAENVNIFRIYPYEGHNILLFSLLFKIILVLPCSRTLEPLELLLKLVFVTVLFQFAGEFQTKLCENLQGQSLVDVSEIIKIYHFKDVSIVLFLSES